MNEIQRIKRIANNVRKWAENNRGKFKVKENLTGMCGIASYELFKRLSRAKLKPTLCHSYFGHAFIECNKHIIDVTATQFTKLANQSPRKI